MNHDDPMNDPGYWASLEEAAAGERVDDGPELIKAAAERTRSRGDHRPRYAEPEWMDGVPFLRDSEGRIRKATQNIYLTLKHDPDLSGLIAMDDVHQTIKLRGPIPVDPESAAETGFPKPMDAIHRTRVLRYLETIRSLPQFGSDMIDAGIDDYAARVRFNSLAEYLHGLRWDLQLRMPFLFKDYFQATHPGGPDVLVDLSNWFLAALVRRALQPGAKFDHAVILTGPEGLGKSTGLKKLVGEQWFSDRMPSLKLRTSDPKRFYAALRGKWLLEVDEGKAFKGADGDDAKSFLTQATDEFIPAYGAEMVVMPRSFLIAITRNPSQDGFLHADAGDRRWWPIEITGPVRTDELERDRDQLLAEAIHYLKIVDGVFGLPDGTDKQLPDEWTKASGAGALWPDRDFEETYLLPVARAMKRSRDEYDDVVAEWMAECPNDRRVKPKAIAATVLGKTSVTAHELAKIGAALLKTKLWVRAESVNGGYIRADMP